MIVVLHIFEMLLRSYAGGAGRVLGKVLRGGEESAFGVLGGGETEWDWDFCEERSEAVGF